MHPLVRALLSAWEWRPEVLIVVVPLGALYLLGWRRLRRQSTTPKLATRLRLAAYLGGLVVVVVALMSPIDRLGSELFFMHMVQHMLLMMFAAPLLLLANPFPFFVWALPPALREPAAGVVTHNPVVRRGLAVLARPDVAWVVYHLLYFGWHDVNAYNAALTHEWVHNVQHVSFFTASLIFWWPVIGSAPHLTRRFPNWGKIAYLIISVPPNMFLGVSIAFSEKVLYTYYESVPRIWGFTLLQDQQLSGAIMWIQGSEMYIVAALIIIARMFGRKGDAHPVPITNWDSDEAMIAPGLEKRVTQNRWHEVRRGSEASQPSR